MIKMITNKWVQLSKIMLRCYLGYDLIIYTGENQGVLVLKYFNIRNMIKITLKNTPDQYILI